MGRGSRGGLAPDGVPEAAGTARPRASVPASPASCPSRPGVRGSHLSRRRSPEPGDLAHCSWGAPSRLAGPSAAVELGRSPPGRMDSPRAAASGWAGSLHRHRLEPSLHRLEERRVLLPGCPSPPRPPEVAVTRTHHENLAVFRTRRFGLGRGGHAVKARALRVWPWTGTDPGLLGLHGQGLGDLPRSATGSTDAPPSSAVRSLQQHPSRFRGK